MPESSQILGPLYPEPLEDGAALLAASGATEEPSEEAPSDLAEDPTDGVGIEVKAVRPSVEAAAKVAEGVQGPVGMPYQLAIEATPGNSDRAFLGV